jgi:hypothetical protein
LFSKTGQIRRKFLKNIFFVLLSADKKSKVDTRLWVWGDQHRTSADTLALTRGSAATLQRGLPGQPLAHDVNYNSAHLNVQRRATAAGEHRTDAIGSLVGIVDAITAGVQTNMSASWHVFVRPLRQNFVTFFMVLTLNCIFN